MAKTKEFNPGDLSTEQIKSVVGAYFGFSPDYFLFTDGPSILVDKTRLEADNNVIFGGWPDGKGPKAHIQKR